MLAVVVVAAAKVVGTTDEALVDICEWSRGLNKGLRGLEGKNRTHA